MISFENPAIVVVLNTSKASVGPPSGNVLIAGGPEALDAGSPRLAPDAAAWLRAESK